MQIQIQYVFLTFSSKGFANDQSDSQCVEWPAIMSHGSGNVSIVGISDIGQCSLNRACPVVQRLVPETASYVQRPLAIEGSANATL